MARQHKSIPTTMSSFELKCALGLEITVDWDNRVGREAYGHASAVANASAEMDKLPCFSEYDDEVDDMDEFVNDADFQSDDGGNYSAAGIKSY